MNHGRLISRFRVSASMRPYELRLRLSGLNFDCGSDANAAMALGAMYDPTVLAKLGVAGLGADVEKARTWYQKAESLGSTEATRRLAILANR